jgi:beta-phosphoglucomutase-like phosphatase (HAD superfamily)
VARAACYSRRVSSHPTPGPAPGLAFIFDMDGVLVHSMPLHTEAWQRYLRNIGTNIPDLEARMHGKRNAELVLDLIDRNLPDASRSSMARPKKNCGAK